MKAMVEAVRAEEQEERTKETAVTATRVLIPKAMRQPKVRTIALLEARVRMQRTRRFRVQKGK